MTIFKKFQSGENFDLSGVSPERYRLACLESPTEFTRSIHLKPLCRSIRHLPEIGKMRLMERDAPGMVGQTSFAQ